MIGTKKDTLDPRYASIGIKFVDELKVLGVKFNATNLNITSINMESILKDIASLIAQWKRRQLTLIGKVTMPNKNVTHTQTSTFVHGIA